jgi:hypothetical protein
MTFHYLPSAPPLSRLSRGKQPRRAVVAEAGGQATGPPPLAVWLRSRREEKQGERDSDASGGEAAGSRFRGRRRRDPAAPEGSPAVSASPAHSPPGATGSGGVAPTQLDPPAQGTDGTVEPTVPGSTSAPPVADLLAGARAAFAGMLKEFAKHPELATFTVEAAGTFQGVLERHTPPSPARPGAQAESAPQAAPRPAAERSGPAKGPHGEARPRAARPAHGRRRFASGSENPPPRKALLGQTLDGGG